MKSGTTTRSLATWVPAGLLLCSIAGHGYQIVAHEEDPQRSGAFAMFATVDIGATRKIIATSTDGSALLEIPESLHARGDDLLDHPSEESAARLADRLRRLTWTVVGGSATEGGPTSFEGVRVQVVGLDAEGRTLGRQVIVDVLAGADS
jgi:hypothetical protein